MSISSTAAPRERPKQILALAGMRAFPPLILVLFHYCEGHTYRNTPAFDFLVGKGYLWVEFFFALSGFVLTYVYAGRWRDMMTARGWAAFVRTRLIRLYPLHLAMTLIFLGLLLYYSGPGAITWRPRGSAVYHPVSTWPTLFANLFLVQAWNLFPYLSWNSVAWFVSAEFFLCLIFPVYALAAREGPREVLRGIGLVAAGFIGLAVLLHDSRYGLDLTFHNGVLRGMSDFSIGAGIAVLFRHAQRVDFSPPTWTLTAAQAVSLLLLAYGIYGTGWAHSKRDLWTVAPMMLLLASLVFDRGIIAEGLKTRVPQTLGRWSFAIYLGQTAWLQLIRQIEKLYPARDNTLMGMRWGDILWWGEPALLVLLCVLWGWFLEAAVEQPAAAWLNRRFKK